MVQSAQGESGNEQKWVGGRGGSTVTNDTMR